MALRVRDYNWCSKCSAHLPQTFGRNLLQMQPHTLPSPPKILSSARISFPGLVEMVLKTHHTCTSAQAVGEATAR